MWNVVASSFFVVVCIFSAVGDVDDGSFDDDVDDDDVVMVLVVEVDLATITLDLTGQELLQVLQEVVVTLVVQVIQITLVVLVKLLLDQEMMGDMVQYM